VGHRRRLYRDAAVREEFMFRSSLPIGLCILYSYTIVSTIVISIVISNRNFFAETLRKIFVELLLISDPELNLKKNGKTCPDSSRVIKNNI